MMSAGIYKRPSIYKRFWAKVLTKEDTGIDCWIWGGALKNNGYAQFWTGKRLMQVHRWAFEQVYGEIPEGRELDHLCRQPACAYPRHLEIVTHLENVQRGNAGKINNWETRKTHCPAGHPYAGDNLYVYNGWRQCRTCIQKRQR